MNDQAFDFDQFRNDFLTYLQENRSKREQAGLGEQWGKNFVESNQLGELRLRFNTKQLTRSQVEGLLREFNELAGTQETFESIVENPFGEIESK